MSELKIVTKDEDNRAIFDVNGIKTLYATGCDTQVTILKPEILKSRFDAELITKNVKLNPYWQVGDAVGSIYKLENFVINGVDFRDLLVFNIEPKFDNLKFNIILGVSFIFFKSLVYSQGVWTFDLVDDTQATVEIANQYLKDYIN